MKTAQVWTFFDGRWHGILLTQGAPAVELHWSEPTDEGWSSATEVYEWPEWDDEFIHCTIYTDGRDCDGRHSTEWQGICSLDNLTALPEEEDEYGYRPARPKWEEVKSGQRDYTAESMGY